MIKIYLLLCLTFAPTVHAKDIEILNEKLGVAVFLEDSRVSQPVATIIEITGRDLREIVAHVNRIVSTTTLHCGNESLIARLNPSANCDKIGFAPTDAKFVSYRELIDAYKSDDVALVIRGQVDADAGPQLKTYFVPLERLIEKVKKGESIAWKSTDGAIRELDNSGLIRINPNRLFQPEEPRE